MIVIYTGIEEIDKEIQMNLRDSIVAHYSDYLIENNTFEGQTVIISPQAVEGDLHEFLFILKQMNMRVILLLKNQKLEELKKYCADNKVVFLCPKATDVEELAKTYQYAVGNFKKLNIVPEEISVKSDDDHTNQAEELVDYVLDEYDAELDTVEKFSL